MEKGYQNPIPAKVSKKTKKSVVHRAAGKVRNFIRKLLRIGALDSGENDPQVIKAQIPRSWFTKKGPGRLKNARRAYAQMTVEQRKIAIDKGWLPRYFASMSKGTLMLLSRN